MSQKGKKLSLVLSIISFIVGILLYAFGKTLNDDPSARLSSFLTSGNANPGDTMITIGMVVLIVAAVLFVVFLVKQFGGKKEESK